VSSSVFKKEAYDADRIVVRQRAHSSKVIDKIGIEAWTEAEDLYLNTEDISLTNGELAGTEYNILIKVTR